MYLYMYGVLRFSLCHHLTFSQEKKEKTEAVWKMFERMETTRRKKLSSVSESNLEETVRSSPGYSSPRGEIKERWGLIHAHVHCTCM